MKDPFGINPLPSPTWSALSMNGRRDWRVDGGERACVLAAGNLAEMPFDPMEDIPLSAGEDIRLPGGVSYRLGEGLSSLALDGRGERLFAVITCFVHSGRAVLECRLPEHKETVLIVRARVADGAELAILERVPGHAKTTLSLGAWAGENAAFRLFQYAPEGGKALFGGYCVLSGRRSRFEGHVGYHAGAGSDLDMNYIIRHEGRETVSDLNVSGGISGGGQKRFRGTLDFVRGCAGAEGSEREDVLLLDEHGVNRTLPVILCGEENVSGTHGASAGRLHEDMLFYLSSRGLDRAAIERMMTGAQLSRALEALPAEAAGLWEAREETDGKIG